MKKERQKTALRILKGSGNLVFTVATIILTFVVLFTATFAWFSMNREVGGSGMQMTVEASPNLIITTDPGTWGNGYFTVIFDGTKESLRPATHDSGNGGTVQLKYLTNPEDIDRTTGLVPTSAPQTPAFTACPTYVADGANYYIDYVCYIASLNKPLTVTDYTSLTATLECNFSSDLNNEAFKAASVDYYINIGDGNGDVYKGTLNAAGLDIVANDGTTPKTEIELLTGTEIPLYTNGNFKITLRCYYDGALLKDSTHTFVTSDQVMTKNADIQFGVKITAE